MQTILQKPFSLFLILVISFFSIRSYSQQCSVSDSITIKGGTSGGFQTSVLDNVSSQSFTFGDTSKKTIQAFSWTNDSHNVHLYNGRTILRFDLNNIGLPANAIITSAKLRLYAQKNAPDGILGEPTYGTNNTGLLQKVIASWKIDSTNYNNPPAVSTNDQKTLAQSANNAENYVIDISDFVTTWVNKPDSNYGMILRMQTENNPYNSLIFEDAYAPDSLKPTLVISYTVEAPGVNQVTIVGDTSNKYQSSVIDNYSSQFQSFGDTGKTYIEAFAWTNNEHGLPLYNGRTLITYNVSSVPLHSTIQSAKLYLYAKNDATNGLSGQPTYGNNNQGLLQRVTAQWNSANTNFNSLPAVDTVDEKILPQSTNTSQDYIVDITDFVQGWVNLPDSNYGMLMRLKTENDPYNSLIFESARAVDSSRRAKIVICYTNTSLPLVFDNFQGAVFNASANLWWTTHNELNMLAIGIEKSYDGSTFTAVTALPAKNTEAMNAYNYVDNNLSAHYNTVYYRLKLINKDGSFTYSNVLMLKYNISQPGVSLYPNPVKSYTQLVFTSLKDENAYIKVSDVAGRTAILQGVHFSTGSNTIIINGFDRLKSGLYILQTNVNGQTVNKKIIVE